MLNRVRNGLYLALFILIAAPAAAQRPGKADITGTIADQSGSILPAATIVIRNLLTGVVQDTVTNDRGVYRITSLDPGLYEIRAALSGFATLVRSDVRISVGEVAHADFTLTLSSIGEVVTVSGEQPGVEITQTQIGQLVRDEQLQNLPVGIRSFINFASLAPGVNANFARAGASFVAGALSSNGQDTRFANFTIDGAPNNDDFVGQTAAAQTGISLDAIAEFQVLTNQSSAEYGRNMGTVLNMVTKSGGNAFRGSSWLFVRDEALEATNEFTKRAGLPKPPFSQKQFGGNLAGPIVKDRTNFFVNYEQILLDIGQTVFIPTRPDLSTNATTSFNVRNMFGRVDHQLNTTHGLTMRYVSELSPGHVQGVGGNVVPEATTEEEDRDTSAVVALTSKWNRSVNQFRFSFAGENIRFDTAKGYAMRPEEIHPGFRAGSAQFIFGLPFDVPVHWTDSSFQFEDSFSIVSGNHDLKVGGSYYHATVERELFPRLGQFFFGTDAVFNAADPATYPIRYNVPVGDRSFKGSNHSAAAFVDDRWTVADHLTLNLGVRWERESITPDANNLAPRLGVAWDVGGDGTTLVRAAYGVYYGQSLFQFYELPFIFGPTGVVVFDVRDNGPLSGQFPVNPVLRNYPQVPTLDRASFPRNPNPDVIDPNRHLPWVSTMSAGGQRSFGDVLVKMDYVYSRGRDLFRSRDINAFDPQTGTRPDPLFGRIRQIETSANSWYHALLTSVTKRFSSRYQVQAAYTLSRAENEADAPLSQPNDEFRPEADKGRATADRTHILAMNGQVSVSRALGVSGIFRYLSGDRYSPITLVDANRNLVNDRLAGYDRNTFVGPSFKTLDLRVTYRLPIANGRELHVSGDLMNAFNWVNYTAPNTVVPGATLPPTFGAPQNALEGRQFQIGLRVNF